MNGEEKDFIFEKYLELVSTILFKSEKENDTRIVSWART